MSYYEWRYLHDKAKVKHALRRSTDAVSMCGAMHVWFAPSSEWRGTGSQHEYERKESLLKCKRCVRIVGEGVE